MKAITQHLFYLLATLVLLFAANAVLAQEENDNSSPIIIEEESTTDPVETESGVPSEIGTSPYRPVPEDTDPTERIEERAPELKKIIEEKRIELRARTQERITNLAANMSNRMEAAIERLQNITNRLDSRIEKLKTNNIDTAAAEDTLSNAQAAIDEAAADIANIDEQVAEFVGSEDPRTAWQALKTTFTEVREHIKDAHTELRSTVALLKTALREGQAEQGVSEAVSTDETASSTITSESNQ